MTNTVMIMEEIGTFDEAIDLFVKLGFDDEAEISFSAITESGKYAYRLSNSFAWYCGSKTIDTLLEDVGDALANALYKLPCVGYEIKSNGFDKQVYLITDDYESLQKIAKAMRGILRIETR